MGVHNIMQYYLVILLVCVHFCIPDPRPKDKYVVQKIPASFWYGPGYIHPSYLASLGQNTPPTHVDMNIEGEYQLGDNVRLSIKAKEDGKWEVVAFPCNTIRCSVTESNGVWSSDWCGMTRKMCLDPKKRKLQFNVRKRLNDLTDIHKEGNTLYVTGGGKTLWFKKL